MISRVYSTNLKGGVQADLTARTLIVGPSAAGKSAIVQALELAAGLGASDVQGRAAVRAVGRLSQLTADGGPPDVEIVGPPPKRLPYREVADALAAGPLAALCHLAGLEPPHRGGEARERAERIAIARTVQDEWFRAHGEDPAWLRWYAAEWAKAGKAAEREAKAHKREAAQLFAEAEPKIKALMATAARYVPADLGQFVIATGTSRKPRCDLGLLRDGRLRVALSGAEWTICVTAVALARADDSSLTVPVDRAMDVDLLHRWLAAMTAAPGQVIVTAIDEPQRVAGWSVQDLASERQG